MKPPFQPLISVAAQEPWAQPCSNGTEPRPSGSGWHSYSLTETKVQTMRWSLGIDGPGVGLNAANDQAFRFNVIERMGSVGTFFVLVICWRRRRNCCCPVRKLPDERSDTRLPQMPLWNRCCPWRRATLCDGPRGSSPTTGPPAAWFHFHPYGVLRTSDLRRLNFRVRHPGTTRTVGLAIPSSSRLSRITLARPSATGHPDEALLRFRRLKDPRRRYTQHSRRAAELSTCLAHSVAALKGTSVTGTEPFRPALGE